MTTAPPDAVTLDELPPDVEVLVETLRGFGRAYPEDIFGPVTAQETKEYGNLITRNSAAMGRHCAQFMVKAADMIEAQARTLKRIQSATMPEPVAWMSPFPADPDSPLKPGSWRAAVCFSLQKPDSADATPLYGPEVLDLLAAEKLKRENAELGERFHDDAANKYAAQVAYWMGKHDETADKLAKVMEGLREPTEEMEQAGAKVSARFIGSAEDAAIQIFHAMSAVLIRSVETPS